MIITTIIIVTVLVGTLGFACYTYVSLNDKLKTTEKDLQDVMKRLNISETVLGSQTGSTRDENFLSLDNGTTEYDNETFAFLGNSQSKIIELKCYSLYIYIY